MSLVERIKREWMAQQIEHVPLKTPDEVERIYTSNLVFAARLQEELGRKLTDREIYDLTM